MYILALVLCAMLPVKHVSPFMARVCVTVMYK